ncbi:MAG: two-component system, OmpR family, sensor kinase [Acidimicrobiaceae bacterium]|nr:two-component system, OmpR family, sensor kinase [Acidimicrobiaceae bacterium]
MPIRFRLALLLAVAAAVAASVGGVIFVNELSASLHRSITTTLQTRAQAITQQLPSSGSLEIQDPGPVRAPIGVSSGQEIVQVLTSNGRVVDSSGPGAAVPILRRPQIIQAMSQPFTFERRPSGTDAQFQFLATNTGGHSTVVVVGTSLETLDQAIQRVIIEIVVGGAIGVLVAGIAGWLLARAALRPVERMRRQAAEMSEHDNDAVLPVPGTRDELAALARTLNGLLGRLHGALSRQRGFVSAAGHELRTPLATLKSELELASWPNRSHAQLVAALEQATGDTDRLVQLTDDLFLLARGDEGVVFVRPEPINMATLVNECLVPFRSRADAAGVAFRLHVPPDLIAMVDPGRFRQVIGNLIDNSLRFAPPGSPIDVRAMRAGSTLVIEVDDHGPGFPTEFIPRAFERFSRPDGSRSREGGGAGLGLAIVKSIVDAHGGVASVANRPDRGSTVRVEIPQEEEP